MDNTHNEFQLTTNDGLSLYGQSWIPKSDKKKVICFIHGIGEHGGRYKSWAERFNKNNIGFFIIDLRGHGKSQGKRGHMPSLNYVLDDIEMFLQYVKSENENIPVILYGHSMGGNILLNYLLRRNPDVLSAISTSPWIRLPFKVPAIKVVLAKIGSKLFPSMQQATGLIIEQISHDKEVIKAYEEDKLNHDKISARTFMELYFSGLAMVFQSKKITLPLLMMHGTGDAITLAKATEEFARHGNDNITCKLWDGCFHELHNEPEKEDVFEFIMNWINKLV